MVYTMLGLAKIPDKIETITSRMSYEFVFGGDEAEGRNAAAYLRSPPALVFIKKRGKAHFYLEGRNANTAFLVTGRDEIEALILFWKLVTTQKVGFSLIKLGQSYSKLLKCLGKNFILLKSNADNGRGRRISEILEDIVI